MAAPSDAGVDPLRAVAGVVSSMQREDDRVPNAY